MSYDGIGLPAGFDIDESKTLGLHLVKILARPVARKHGGDQRQGDNL
ncbi:MAG: hypothetical protein U9Q68_11880 [Euryarchaeota archaeon]|nr:hypothetical protein [Euryarchaeota archaeon]